MIGFADMSAEILMALDSKIADLESQLVALKTARSALGGVSRGRPRGGRVEASTRKRSARKFTAAQRAQISRRMKALWAKRRAGKR